MEQHQALQPAVRLALRSDGEAEEEGGERHHAVAQQVVVEQQAAPLIVQNPARLVAEVLQADAGRLGEVHQQDQHGIDRREDQPDVRGDPPIRAALLLEARSHHDVADGQQHAHEVGSKEKIDDHADRKQEYGRRNHRRADSGNKSVHRFLL